jgi:hypothetical protein
MVPTSVSTLDLHASDASWHRAPPTIDPRERYEDKFARYVARATAEEKEDAHLNQWTAPEIMMEMYKREAMMYRAMSALRLDEVAHLEHHTSATPTPSPPPAPAFPLPWKDEPLLPDNYSGTDACLVCMARRASTISIACGHASLCVHCASSTERRPTQCPICRTSTPHIIRMYPRTE